MSEAATASQLEKSGQEASSYGEELEMLRESDGMHLEGTMVRHATKAGKKDDLFELLKSRGLEGEDTGVLSRGEAGGR